MNNSMYVYTVQKGDRIAQLVCEKVSKPAVVEVQQLGVSTHYQAISLHITFVTRLKGLLSLVYSSDKINLYKGVC